MTEKREKLLQLMEEYTREPVCLAFSGGVDSSLLLYLLTEAAKKHGTRVTAVTFHTMLHPLCDLENAKAVAEELGAIHEIIKINELKVPKLLENPPERCYLCKKHLFQTLKEYGAARGISCFVDGTNEDDLHVYRPGLRALRELGIQSPLAQCHLTKAEVRQLAAEAGISAASRPSTPCMATRLPYGSHLDYEILRRIEAGESYLKTLFHGNVRLRLHGDVARLELDPAEFPLALTMRTELCGTLKQMGFPYVTLDLSGFRSGSMDLGMEAGKDRISGTVRTSEN